MIILPDNIQSSAHLADIRLDDPQVSRNMIVWWEGSEPFLTTAREANAQLWCARFTGCHAKACDRRDVHKVFSGNRHLLWDSDLFQMLAFNDLESSVREFVMKAFEQDRLNHLRDLIAEAFQPAPELVIGDSREQPHLCLGTVECYADVSFSRCAPRCKYIVGSVTADDFVITLETHSDREAAIRFATMAFEDRIRATIAKATGSN